MVRTRELGEITRARDAAESNLKHSEEKIKILHEEKIALELKCKEQSTKLNNLMIDYENCTALVQNSSKNNAFLKVIY